MISIENGNEINALTEVAHVDVNGAGFLIDFSLLNNTTLNV